MLLDRCLHADLVSIPNMPWKWQVRSMGLVDLLLESCPAVAGPTLQGTLNPAGIPELQSAQHSASDISTGDDAEAHAVTGAEDKVDGSAEAASMHEDHAGAAEGVPAAKRQRVSEFADARGDATGDPSAADGAADAAAGEPAASLVPHAVAAGDKQDPQSQQLPAQQQHRQSDADGSNGQDDNDDALLAGLEWDTDSPDNGDTDLAGSRRKRRKRQQDADAASDADGLDGLQDSEQDDGGDGVETEGGAGEHDGVSGEGQQQELMLLEGDYPEADEDAIRAEAVSASGMTGQHCALLFVALCSPSRACFWSTVTCCLVVHSLIIDTRGLLTEQAWRSLEPHLRLYLAFCCRQPRRRAGVLEGDRQCARWRRVSCTMPSCSFPCLLCTITQPSAAR